QHYSQIFVLADENTCRHCLPYFLENTGLHEKITMTEIQSGEAEKSLATCEKIWQAMLAAKLDRRALVVNLGGGVIGDMGGFCAATWKRGIDFVQVPTTLLSMTDAAIGGKTGIDFQGIKNTIGVFQQPAAVFVAPVFLQTLPERELRSGYAEVIKHALIGGPELAQQLSEEATSSCLLTSVDWLDILQKSIAVKVRVVQEDPLEKGLRMLLNFGHSIGHALESWFLETDEALTHGEAVFIGMVCEAFLAKNEILWTAVLSLGQKVFPHRNIAFEAFPAIWELMQQDKKNSSGTVRMAVPDELPYSLKIIEPTKSEVERSLAFYNTLS
ncbi:MAG: 3-dehydroquinate synthase, partial [Phycisphaerae bacterium]|nr:3-dehydroquinate synthase [Saprospiraceae bacterium]